MTLSSSISLALCNAPDRWRYHHNQRSNPLGITCRAYNLLKVLSLDWLCNGLEMSLHARNSGRSSVVMLGYGELKAFVS